MTTITSVLGREYNLVELDFATVEYGSNLPQVWVWKDGYYILHKNFDSTPEAEEYCSELNDAIAQAHKNISSHTVSATTTPMENYINFAKSSKTKSSPNELLESMTAEQRDDYEDILQEYPEIDTKWLANKIVNNQYHHYRDHNFNWIGRELVYRRHPQLPDWLSYYIDFRRYTEDVMCNNPNFKVTNCGVYEFI